MRFKEYILLITVILLFCIYGCSSDGVEIDDIKFNKPKSNETKLMVKGASGWYVKYVLNGEPAFVGYGEYFSNVTPFSINGLNQLILEAEQRAFNTSIMASAKIFTLKGSSENLIKTFSSMPDEKSYRSTFDFEFKTERKIWQISEEIGDFSPKDRAFIEKIINGFNNILESADIDSLESFGMYQWNLKDTKPQKGIDKNLLHFLTKLLKSSKYHIDSPPLKELSFIKGKKLVLFYHHGGHVIKIEPKDGFKKKNEWYISFPVLRMYFIKIQGNWEMMHLLDDTLMGG